MLCVRKRTMGFACGSSTSKDFGEQFGMLVEQLEELDSCQWWPGFAELVPGKCVDAAAENFTGLTLVNRDD